ncbi:MAG: hypothetical protein DMG21_14475 [Acidobacteria bacterium]|nr:MAG: hypothetical protein DMG21_14475 [Acidobacteriota bacterium]
MLDAKRVRQAACVVFLAMASVAAMHVLAGQDISPGRRDFAAQASAQPAPQGIEPLTPAISEKQKRDLLKYNFGQMKKDAEELATLAKSLEDDLEHSNQNVLSLGVISKAEKIEKLAKKIRSTAKELPPEPLPDGRR